ncbi:EAL domain-containing protein [Actimicrobium sp. CCC2.4]|uniref:putative bifunctional diguanylate cyclase/phosphodiesterase n=1 Tax=Actimicrobium sp. CCC2.4 TaxID=3048606 RepID=UPI002AC93707|nr:EAL domain-containing protein [Actimicrobium sp. CCC2.4]MEB0135486.1 EAL domain-containing protein [Actimicrobium sp. CCC2.4]WPX34057.1 EAL domain-containing protein [Actimicrobium sp. CCC2.4]
MEAAGDAVFCLDDRGRILYVSQRALEFVGTGVSIVGWFLSELAPLSDRLIISLAITQALESGRSGKINTRINTRKSSMWFELQLTNYVTPEGTTALLVVGRDISVQQDTEERLRHMATHDALTGLPNRSLLSDRLQMAIAQAKRTGRGFSVLALDLDRFKKVNDALGHLVGDTLLRVAGERLRETLRNVDTLARVGGDEFVAVLPGAVSEAEIQTVARRMIANMQVPFEIQGHTLYVGASIGAATYPDHGDDDVKLLSHADTAMCHAKETGKARCVVYNPQKFNQQEYDVSMEAAMFDAVRNGEFFLHYQPIVDAVTCQVLGFEALMRWMRPELGPVPPSQFIPMAESNGLINLLGAWALRSACMQIKRFQEVAGRPLYVSVNVSPRQFRNDQFLGVMDNALSMSGLVGSELLLEITEGILMSDPEHAEAMLNQISSRGVKIAIDDFGTGYSSLAYLKRFPISTLKIDRAFVQDLPESVKDAAICNVVLSLASHLNLSTVAEGVENAAQLEFLARQGCTLIQGYFTGRPMLPEAAITLLQTAAVPAPSLAKRVLAP